MAYKKLKLWFDEELAEFLSEKLIVVYPDFDREGFAEAVALGVDELELKARVELIADELHARLPTDYAEALELLVSILGVPNPFEDGMFTVFFWVMPIAKFVEKYGLDDYDLSIAAIKEITQRNTGEYCIRPFLERYPEQTLAVLLDWASDESVHVRRLASEGPRPRLPWATKLQQFIDDPKPLLPILERLKDDPSKFVQKSVANTMNDILKDNYAIGMERLKDWAIEPTVARKWIIKHALRNYRKAGDATALELLERIK